MIPVNKSTNIEMMMFNKNINNTIPNRGATSVIVRFMLFCSSISDFTTFSLSSPPFKDGLTDNNLSTLSTPMASLSVVPYCNRSHGFSICIANNESLISTTLSFSSFSTLNTFVPVSKIAADKSAENSFNMPIYLGA